MVAILILAASLACILALLLARYGPPILDRSDGRRRGVVDARPSISASSLRALTVELLAALGLSVVSDPDGAAGDENRLMATRLVPLAQIRYVVDLAPSPPGDRVDQAAVLSLVEDVKAERAAAGLLITPGEIETAGLAGLEVELELIDGSRFRDLIALHLPRRLGELDRYRGFLDIQRTPKQRDAPASA
jgi:hypothetical protein